MGSVTLDARIDHPGSEWRVFRALQLANFNAPMLEMAFRRYVHTAGLFGTPDGCRERLQLTARFSADALWGI